MFCQCSIWLSVNCKENLTTFHRKLQPKNDDRVQLNNSHFVSLFYTHGAIGINTIKAAYSSPGEKISACHTSIPWHTHVFFSQAKAFPIKDSSFTLDPWIAVFQERKCSLIEDWKRCCHCCQLQLGLGISKRSSIIQEGKKKIGESQIL